MGDKMTLNDWNIKRDEKINDTISKIGKRCEEMRSALSKLSKAVDYHECELVNEARTFMEERLTELNKHPKDDEPNVEELALPSLVYEPCYFSTALPSLRPGSVYPWDPECSLSHHAIPESLVVKTEDLEHLRLGSISTPDRASSSPSSSDAFLPHSFQYEYPSSNEPDHDLTMCHQLCKAPGSLTAFDFNFSFPEQPFIAAEEGLFKKEGETEWKKFDDQCSISLCLAVSILFVSEGTKSDRIRRYEVQRGDPPEGPLEIESIIVRGANLMTGVDCSDDGLLAVCDYGLRRITVHRVEDGHQVDVCKGQEMFGSFLHPWAVVWLDTDRLCVLLDKVPLKKSSFLSRLFRSPKQSGKYEHTVCCFSIRFKEVLWRSKPLPPDAWSISLAYGRLYVAHYSSPSFSVLDSSSGMLLQQVTSPEGLPCRVFGRDDTITACSYTFQQPSQS